MSLFTQEQLLKDFRSRDYIDFVDQRVDQEQTNLMQNLYARRLVYADAVVLEVYQSLIWLFETYPSLKKVKPIWMPHLDEDNMFNIRFRLEIETQEDTGLVSKVYGYDDPPDSFEAMGQATFDLAIEIGESVAQEIWNEFSCTQVSVRKEPYLNADDIMMDMKEDIGPEFLAQVQQWLLNRTTHTISNPSSKSPRL